MSQCIKARGWQSTRDEADEEKTIVPPFPFFFTASFWRTQRRGGPKGRRGRSQIWSENATQKAAHDKSPRRAVGLVCEFLFGPPVGKEQAGQKASSAQVGWLGAGNAGSCLAGKRRMADVKPRGVAREDERRTRWRPLALPARSWLAAESRAYRACDLALTAAKSEWVR